MNILVDFNHPAHFHFFGPAIRRWRKEGHTVILTARKKDVLLDLLQEAGEEAVVISRIRTGRVGQMIELLERVFRIVPLILRHRIDVLTGVGGASVTHSAWLCRKPSIAWSNAGHAKLANNITFPFATVVATPETFRARFGKKHRTYRGIHEKSYIPLDAPKGDRGLLKEFGIDPDRPFSLVRIVSWQASHDTGHHGLGLEGGLRLIRSLERYGQVVLSVEDDCPDELREWVRPIPALRMREVLPHAACYVGEGATMAAEAALWGIPNIFFSTIRLGYLDDMEEKFGISRSMEDLDEALAQIEEWFADPDLEKTFDEKRRRYYAETDDVPDLMHDWVLELGETGRLSD